eukprot:COSAG01_NODE_81_length_27820_cov_22.659753_14_plen_144_part_00
MTSTDGACCTLLQIIAEYVIGAVCMLVRASSEENTLPKIVAILANVRARFDVWSCFVTKLNNYIHVCLPSAVGQVFGLWCILVPIVYMLLLLLRATTTDETKETQDEASTSNPMYGDTAPEGPANDAHEVRATRTMQYVAHCG